MQLCKITTGLQPPKGVVELMLTSISDFKEIIRYIKIRFHTIGERIFYGSALLYFQSGSFPHPTGNPISFILTEGYSCNKCLKSLTKVLLAEMELSQ